MAMSFYLFCAVSCFITGRVCRDALFLEAFDKDALAAMYITVALIVPIPAYLYSRIADKFRRDKIIKGTLLALAVVTMAVFLWATFAPSGVTYIFLYNFVEMLGSFLLIQFWTLASDIFSSREAKRLFPVIGGGGVLAGVACGVSVGEFGRQYGAERLLLLMIVFLAACYIIVHRLGKAEGERLQNAIVGRHRAPVGEVKTPGLVREIRDVFQSKHLKIVAGMTILTFLTVPLIDYQFKVMAKQAFTVDGVTSKEQLTLFFGLFYTLTGTVAAATQFFVTGRVLERFGIVSSLMVLPLFLLVGSVGSVLAFVAGAISWMFPTLLLTKGAENSFRYSIYDATMQVIYTPVPGHLRGRAKTLIDGVLKPWSGGIAGLTILLVITVLNLEIAALSGIAIAFIFLWCGFVLAIGREYVAQLLQTLRRRRLDFSQEALDISDEKTVGILRRVLASDNQDEITNALALIQRVDNHKLGEDVVKLVDHDSPEIRLHSLAVLRRVKSRRHVKKIQERFQDESPEVRAEAVRTCCAILGEPAIRLVQKELTSNSPIVRGATVASLIKFGGLEGILLSAEHLKEMQVSEEPSQRLAAANVFAEIKVRNFYRPVLELLRDKDFEVQRAAILAAQHMASVELIPALVYKLSNRKTARHAAGALAGFGDSVVPTLGKILGHAPESPHIRQKIPRILERVGTQAAFEVLINSLEVDEPDTRREVARSAAKLRDTLDADVDATRVRSLLRKEISGYYQLLAALDDLSTARATGPDLLRTALEERMDRALDRIFHILGILYPVRTIEVIRGSINSVHSNVKSNAIEVLDNLLDRDERRLILPIVEGGSRARVLAKGLENFELERKGISSWVREFLGSSEPWLAVVAIHMVRELALDDVLDQVRDHLANPHAIARETALYTLRAFVTPAELKSIAEELLDDHDDHVRLHAERTLASLADSCKPS